MSQDYSSPEEFEKSFAGFHRDAPSYLKKQSEAIKKNIGEKGEKSWAEAHGQKEGAKMHKGTITGRYY